MKRSCTLLALCISCSLLSAPLQVSSQGQLPASTKSNEPALSVELSDPLSVLNGSIGYSKTSTGEWVSQGDLGGFSALPDPISRPVNGKVGVDLTKAANYHKMEVRNISLRGKAYMALLIYQMGGAYKFTELNKDWQGYRFCDYYVFRKENIADLKSACSLVDKPYSVPFHSLYSGTVFSSKLTQIASAIGEATSSNGNSSKDIVFDVLPIEEGEEKKLRFLFRNALFLNGESYSKFDPAVFDQHYFELPMDRFLSFVKVL